MDGTTNSIGSSLDRVNIKKSLNLLGAVAMIVGSMVGSGIFISPKGILEYTGSVGLNLILWALCGMIAMGGALCFAELGTLIGESGGPWAYIRAGFGDAPAFVVAWTSILIPAASSAVISLSCAEYLLLVFFGDCNVPVLVGKLSGILILWLVTYINLHVDTAAKILKVLLLMKVLALTLILVGGIYWIVIYGFDNLDNAFEGSTSKPWSVATAFYSGLWAYDGWNTANFVTEEVKDAKRNMPRAIIMSTLLVIGLYLVVNVSYYAVLTQHEVLQSTAVAMDWGSKVVGDWSRGFSVIVSLSILGSSIAGSFGTSRIAMVVARAGHTVQVLSMVKVKDNAPSVSLLTNCFLTTVFILVGGVNVFINLFNFCAWLFYGMSFVSLIILRVRKYRRDDDSVFRVPVLLPVLMTAVSLYLIIMPVATEPTLEYLIAIVVMLSGLIFYFTFVYCKWRLPWFNKVTVFLQLLLRVSVPNKDE